MNLIAAAIIGIAIIVLLIAVCKVHPFLSLLAGSFTMAVCASVEYDKAFGSFTSGIGDVIANSITESAMNPLIAGWLVAVLIRLATGSATVATVTASGIMVPLATGMNPTHLALLVLAIGAGSVFFSHLNDAGFWLVKEYFGMTVGQTLKTWSLMETILSVVGLGCVMLLSLVL